MFIAACLLDLFPDVREAVDHVLDEIERKYHTKVDYPMAEFIIVIGFFMVLIIEQMVLEFKTDSAEEVIPNENSPLLPTSNTDEENTDEENGEDGSSQLDVTIGGLSHDSHSHHHHHILEHSSLRLVSPYIMEFEVG